MDRGLMPLNQYEVDILAIYNSEEARGIVHTKDWNNKMKLFQIRFNLVGFKKPEEDKDE